MLILTPVIYYNVDSFREVISDLVESSVGRAILVFSSAVKGQVMKVRSFLRESGIQVEVSELCESDASALSSILSQMRAYRPDCIIGMGGGHCMDIAKVLRVLYEDPNTTLSSLAMGTNRNDGEKSLKRAMIHRRGSLIRRLVCIPTTCGSGSEVTSTAVLRNDDGRQVIVSGVAFLPDISIVDSSFISTIPMFIASITGLRSLLHGLEAYISNSSNHYSSCMAVQSLRILFAHLVKAVTERNVHLLQEVHKAASISGVAISATDVGLGTVISRSISEVFTLPHGLIDGILITHVLNFNLKGSPRVGSLIAGLSVELGLSSPGDSDSAKIQAFLDQIGQIRRSLLLPNSLSSIHSALSNYKSRGWLDPIAAQTAAFPEFNYHSKHTSAGPVPGALSGPEGQGVYVSEDDGLRTIPILGRRSIIENLNARTFESSLEGMVSRALSDDAILTNPVALERGDLVKLLKEVWG
ncbi:NAD dependent dehydrogenase [Cryptosporidium canis]|uniref:NAD dependent dehydrogenase n=1 Tax=Cryptosporidium canis TaxID=195482 RepID=A0ABQ8P3M2_9CRYT|nr:NAD dependent dehydrogenase [Cryptosporidium canis]